MKIAFVSPAGAMHRYNGSFHKNLHYAPITLTLLSALIPEELNTEVKIYDETAEAIPLDLDADVVCITCVTGTSARSYKFADYFRGKGKTVIMGGAHPSLLPNEAKEHADSVIVGLGDRSFPKALLDHSNGRLREFYYQEPRDNIANRPLPRRDLLKKNKYITLNTVEVVRGCNLNCSFCAYPKAFGRNILTRPVDEVIAEIKTLKGKIIIFPDVNLLADYEYAKELFKALIPLKRWWLGLTTSEIGLDDEMLDLFKKSGCKGLLIGFESVNQASQKEMRKGVNKVDEYKALMEKLHNRGIMVMGCFAFGGDEDYKDVFEKTFKMVQECKIDLPRYAILTPFPNTDLYNDLENENRVVERNWALYDVEHVVYKPKNMTKQELEDGIKWIWKETYKISNIFKRIAWNKPIVHALGVLVNIGYRKYAKKFDMFNDETMLDNSDIPEAAK